MTLVVQSFSPFGFKCSKKITFKAYGFLEITIGSKKLIPPCQGTSATWSVGKTIIWKKKISFELTFIQQNFFVIMNFRRARISNSTTSISGRVYASDMLLLANCGKEYIVPLTQPWLLCH